MTFRPSTTTLMKVFWPLQGIGAQEGQLLGWSVGDSIVVVGVQSEVCTAGLEQAQLKARHVPQQALSCRSPRPRLRRTALRWWDEPVSVRTVLKHTTMRRTLASGWT
jgi:hypothetical protein